MVDYKRAILRPFSDWKKLSIGFLLNIVPIVNLIMYGYALECARTAMKKRYKLPEWKKLGDLFIQGLKAAVIGFVYALPLIIIAVVVLSIFVSTMIRSLAISEAVSENWFVYSLGVLGGSPILPVLILLVLISIVYALAMSYFVPMAIMNFVNKKKFSAGFDFRTILKKALTGKYFVAWLVVAGIAIGWSIVRSLFSPLNAVPLLGLILNLVVSVYVSTIIQITSMTIYGEIYREIK